MPISWDAEAETRLLLGVLEQFKGARLDYKALAEYMGPDCSIPAVKQHICKLRREAGSSAYGRGRTSTGNPPPSASTKKSKRARSPETPIKRAKGVYCIVDEDEVEEKETKLTIKKEDEKKDLSFVDLSS
ncbi:hypothetical protein BJX61DRAFT_178343 [Aspergillus egyptiacus]|nr:hypothetical protein BJX61DRAFT_178343 [Aspergillus egyptiacus]